MALFGMGRRPKPLQFKYVPRYYDPIKDDLESRIGKAENSEATKARIKSGLRRGFGGSTIDTRAQKRASSIRLVLIIVALVLIVYLIMVSNSFLEFVQTIEKIEKAG